MISYKCSLQTKHKRRRFGCVDRPGALSGRRAHHDGRLFPRVQLERLVRCLAKDLALVPWYSWVVPVAVAWYGSHMVVIGVARVPRDHPLELGCFMMNLPFLDIPILGNFPYANWIRTRGSGSRLGSSGDLDLGDFGWVD